MADKMQTQSGMTTRTRITIVVMVIVVGIIIWQVIDMFGGSTTTVSTIKNTKTNTTTAAGGMSSQQPSLPTPKPAPLTVASAPQTAREAELMRMQEELQARYVAALNELQMLKIASDIADANQKIMSSKLSTVVSQKKIVEMLSPPVPVVQPETYAKNIGQSSVAPPPLQAVNQPVNISVISVSQIQYQWNAVLGSQGRLYNVKVGDVLPFDGSKVVNIDKSGIILDANGVRRRISLVPII